MSPTDSGGSPWAVVGLGNPGPEYAGHRHNAGAMVAELLCSRMGASLRAHRRARARVAEGRLVGERVVLATPTTYMNDSGAAVAAVCDFYRVEPDRLVVVHDELDLPFGGMRLKIGGGDNGHNGLRSVRRSLGTGEFYRVRVGVGRPPGRLDPAVYVLRDFSAAERKELGVVVERAADAVEALLAEGLDRAQQAYNS